MKFPKKLLLVITLVFASLLLFACEDEVVVDADPVLSGVGAVAIDLYEVFNPLAGVAASDVEDGDLTAGVIVKSNNVDNTVVGTYSVVYEVTDSALNVVQVSRTVTVNELAAEDYPLAQYLSGVDLSKLPGEDKAVLFAAAERYLLDNVLAGVPLYTGNTRVMYSNRVQLFSPIYNGVLGFGVAFSQFTADDSTVYINGSTMGNAGEYTWRASFDTDPTSLNPWNADDSNTATFTDHFNGALYDFYFDATKSSYEILPSLAKSEPIPVNPTVINGKTYAKVWQIEVRDDLEWKFHPSTDVTGLAEGYEKLDASDYLWTWQHALENDWFRARTGGGDFVSQGIKNAAEFLNDSVEWSEVGLRLAEGKTNTIELEYTNEKSTFEIKYGFAGAVLTPINQELFEELGEDYGMTPTDVASSGIYYFDQWTEGQVLIFKKNELHPDAEMYHYTGYQYRYVKGSDAIFAEFEAGRLESASVPASRVTEFENDPRVKEAPAATTWRLMINAFGTVEARDAYNVEHPEVGLDETWVPEPILSYLPMRQALYYGFDREYAAVELVKLYLPAHTLFAPTYFIDAESALGVRGSDAGQAVFDDFGGDSYGYFPDAALDLFKEAVAAAIADDHYDAGTAQAYTVITFQLYYASSNNTAAQAMVANIEEQYEALLVDDENFVRIDIVVNDVSFPGNYYTYMMKAKMDLGIGGISGSLLDAPSFLDVFSDDNRGGFTLNWGIDTTTANIPVAYHNLEGKLVYEMWGFNALIEALVGRIYVSNGSEQVAWSNADDLVNAYLDMNGEVLDSSSDGAVLAGYILGDSLADIALEEEFDELVAKIVVTESGKNMLYVISKEGSQYKLYDQAALFTTPDEAIESDSGYGLIAPAVKLATDAEVAANAYIAASYGYLTIAEIATDAGSPLEFTEVYACDWDGWSDAYVVVHIGDYYIGWLWL